MKTPRSSSVRASTKSATGSLGFDEITGGGLPRSRTTLLVGGPGSGKAKQVEKGHAMSRRSKFKFRLYVAGDAQNSAQAVANLTAFCRAYLLDRHTIEVVNVFREPKRALADGILMTPTLVKLAPAPSRKIVGTLSQTQPMLQALGLSGAQSPAA